MSRVDYDAELQMHNEVLRRAYCTGPNDHVLDIGCGAGQTTRDAARFATVGRVVGVDNSASMIARARELTEKEGLHNVAFLQADVEIHHFPAKSFDIAISRFGEVARYEDSYRLCYLRGPAAIIIELAERIS